MSESPFLQYIFILKDNPYLVEILAFSSHSSIDVLHYLLIHVLEQLEEDDDLFNFDKIV